jgi:hypothetical protein
MNDIDERERGGPRRGPDRCSGGRRLTLAPRPWVGCGRGARSATVSYTLFAGPQESGGVQVAAEASPEAGTWSVSGRSSIASSSSVREFERATNGSRFWVLAEDGESETDSSVDGDVQWNS